VDSRAHSRSFCIYVNKLHHYWEKQRALGDDGEDETATQERERRLELNGICVTIIWQKISLKNTVGDWLFCTNTFLSICCVVVF
jgi:hypothetical protein